MKFDQILVRFSLYAASPSLLFKGARILTGYSFKKKIVNADENTDLSIYSLSIMFSDY